MKKNSIQRNLRIASLYFILIFGGIFVFSCKNKSENALSETISMPESTITSLNCGVGDTLLVGTKNGRLYYFCTTTEQFVKDYSIGGNNHCVHIAFPLKDSLFVSVSNEGLKMYYGDTNQPKKVYKFGAKKYSYSVYKILRIGDTLLCATSNGLAKLDLSCTDCDSLQLLYPDCIRNDYKIKDIKISSDGTKLYVYDEKEELTFLIGKYDTILSKKPYEGPSPYRTVLHKSRIYSYKQEERQFYVIPDSTIIGEPHNFVFVRQYQKRHNKNSLFAIIEDASDGNRKKVYIGTSDGLRLNKTWSRTLGNINGSVTEMVYLPNGLHLFLEKTGQTGQIYYGNRHKVTKWIFEQDSTQRVKCLYYHHNWKKVYFALGAGFVSIDLNSNSSHDLSHPKNKNIDTTIQCFAAGEDKLYLGTMQNGIIAIDRADSLIGSPLLSQKDIKDLKYNKTSGILYALTSDSLFFCYINKDSIASTPNTHHFVKLYFFKKLFGVTDNGQLYTYDEGSWFWQSKSMAGLVNPNAVCSESDLITGTDKGLYIFDNDNTQQVAVEDSFLKSHLLLFVVLATIATIIFILWWMLFTIRMSNLKKNRIIKKIGQKYTRISGLETEKKEAIETFKKQITGLTEAISALQQPNDEKAVQIPRLEHEKELTIDDLTQYIATLTNAISTIQQNIAHKDAQTSQFEQEKEDEIETLKRQNKCLTDDLSIVQQKIEEKNKEIIMQNPYLKIDTTGFSTSTDSRQNKWVLQNAREYVTKKNAFLESKDSTLDCDELVPYAFAMELYNLHNIWGKRKDLDNLNKEVDRLKDVYLQKCLPLSENAKDTIKLINQNCYLHLCILSLLSLKTEDGGRFITGNNNSLTTYLQKCRSGKKCKPTDVANKLREHIQNDDLFSKTEPYGELYDTLMGEFKTELKIKDKDVKPNLTSAIKSVELLSTSIEDYLKPGTNTRKKWCRDVRKFYGKIFRMLFTEVNETGENALRVWCAVVILKDRKDLQTEEELLKLVNVLLPEKEQIQKIPEDWLQNIINSEIKPNPDYKDVFDNEWKNATTWLKTIAPTIPV